MSETVLIQLLTHPLEGWFVFSRVLHWGFSHQHKVGSVVNVDIARSVSVYLQVILSEDNKLSTHLRGSYSSLIACDQSSMREAFKEDAPFPRDQSNI